MPRLSLISSGLIFGSPDYTVTQEFKLLKYTAARILVFVAFLVVFYLLGLREFTLIIVALLISGIVSLFALNTTREAAASKIAKLFKKTN